MPVDPGQDDCTSSEKESIYVYRPPAILDPPAQILMGLFYRCFCDFQPTAAELGIWG